MLELVSIFLHYLIEVIKPYLPACIGVLLLSVFGFFFLRGAIHLFRLRKIHIQIERFEKNNTPTKEFEKLFVKDKQLAHLWSEFSETLHKQTVEHEGQQKIRAVRATIPAEMYFNNQFVVDSRLRTELFKHFPGIFTGVGIIGTFFGLMGGLGEFKISENALEMRTRLEALMHTVGEAFLISAAAITIAMVVTLLEKLLLASLYKKTEAIAHAIDAHFDAGVGEEYLSELVSSSKESVSQSKILKDALVTDLKDILREITDAQIAASRENNQSLGNVIAERIEQSLRAPLDKIAATVESASGDQSASAVKMLNDVMVSFSQRLNDLFGGQINGINELNQKTAQGMQDAVAALNTLVGKLEENGKKNANDMGTQLAASIKAMEEQQATINTQTQAIVAKMNEMIQSSQTETQQKLHSTLDILGQKMTQLVGQLNDSQNKVFEENRAREHAMAVRSANSVSQMTASVDSVVEEISKATAIMSQSVTLLASTTSDNIQKMNQGAACLDSAANNFASAGENATNAMNKVSTIATKLSELSGGLTTSSSALQDCLNDYKNQRNAIVELLNDLNTIVSVTKKEASLTGEILKNIESSAEKLNQAQRAANEYLDGVSEVLAESNEKFQQTVVSTLGRVNSEFHDKLSDAVGLLSSSVQELDDVFNSLPTRR